MALSGRLAVVILALVSALPAEGLERRFALLVGAADGGAGTQQLRFAERDARRMRATLTRLGGIRPEDARLLLGPGADEFRQAMAEMGSRSLAARQHGDRTVLLVYYSGHAKEGFLRLRETRLGLEELKRLLAEAPADIRIGLLDSCRSGAITRAKGLRRAPAFDVSRASGPRGLVLVTSSGADEDSQESDLLGGSFFTHHLVSGLLGDADTSGDGKVTLAEAYAHAYGRTVASTADTVSGVQHPTYLYDLGGAGDVVLTQLPRRGGALVFPAKVEGSYVVLDGSRRAVAEVSKLWGSPRRLALPAGHYTVKKRLPAGDSLLLQELDLGDDPVELEESRMQRVALSRDPQKGFGGSRWSLVSGLGGQLFFGPSNANGIFPPAALGGVELVVRNDLGHGLAWGFDAALGGGASDIQLGSSSIAMRFFEATGGASLSKELTLGSVTLSGGVRLACLYLNRSFPGRSDLPPQYFFTVTPGLTAGASWHLSSRLSATARVRGQYLFYNIDRDTSLGFAELLLGVEYALGN